MQKCYDDLQKALEYLAEAEKNVSLALNTIKSARSIERMDKLEIEARSRAFGFVVGIQAHMSMMGNALARECVIIEENAVSILDGMPVHSA